MSVILDALRKWRERTQQETPADPESPDPSPWWMSKPALYLAAFLALVVGLAILFLILYLIWTVVAYLFGGWSGVGLTFLGVLLIVMALVVAKAYRDGERRSGHGKRSAVRVAVVLLFLVLVPVLFISVVNGLMEEDDAPTQAATQVRQTPTPQQATPSPGAPAPAPGAPAPNASATTAQGASTTTAAPPPAQERMSCDDFKVNVTTEWSEEIRCPRGLRLNWTTEAEVDYQIMTADGEIVTFPAKTLKRIIVPSGLHPWFKFRAAEPIVIHVTATPEVWPRP